MTIKRLSFLTILLTYFLIVFGGYVASSNSGMGCGPEWPLCNGAVIPELEGTTLIEFMHRVIGALLGLLTFLLFLKMLQSKAKYSNRTAAFLMLFLLTIQILFGAIVVIWDLPSLIITIHLLIAMFFLATIIWIWRNVEETNINRQQSTPLIKHLNITLVLVTLTLGFGAYIKHQTYGLACGWLGCRQSFLPMSIPEIMQTIHRGLAMATAIYILLLTYWAFEKKSGSGLQRRLLLCSLTVLLQLAIGIAVILTTLEISWAVLHLAVGTAMFAFVSETRVYAAQVSSSTRAFIVTRRNGESGRRSME
ncbi:COX15/CtaA family protein [Neobacillus sp. K501]